MDKQNSSRITINTFPDQNGIFFILFWGMFGFEERGKPEWRRRPLFKKERETASPLGYGPAWREAIQYNTIQCSLF